MGDLSRCESPTFSEAWIGFEPTYDGFAISRCNTSCAPRDVIGPDGVRWVARRAAPRFAHDFRRVVDCGEQLWLVGGRSSLVFQALTEHTRRRRERRCEDRPRALAPWRIAFGAPARGEAGIEFRCVVCGATTWTHGDLPLAETDGCLHCWLGLTEPWLVSIEALAFATFAAGAELGAIEPVWNEHVERKPDRVRRQRLGEMAITAGFLRAERARAS
jgi:hypothetical protein